MLLSCKVFKFLMKFWKLEHGGVQLAKTIISDMLNVDYNWKKKEQSLDKKTVKVNPAKKFSDFYFLSNTFFLSQNGRLAPKLLTIHWNHLSKKHIYISFGKYDLIENQNWKLLTLGNYEIMKNADISKKNSKKLTCLSRPCSV